MRFVSGSGLRLVTFSDASYSPSGIVWQPMLLMLMRTLTLGLVILATGIIDVDCTSFFFVGDINVVF